MLRCSRRFLFGFTAVLAACLLIGCGDGVNPPRYKVTQMISNPTLGTAEGMNLNDAGDVVGSFCPLPRGLCKPFIFRNNQLELINLNIADAKYAAATLITSDGLVAGTYQTERPLEAGGYGSFLYKDGKLNPFKPAWPLDGFHVLGMNARGDAIGIGYSSGAAFTYLNGKLRVLKGDEVFKPFLFSYSSILNEAGQIAGNPQFGALLESESSRSLAFPAQRPQNPTPRLKPQGSEWNIQRVNALNNFGHVVGQVNLGSGHKTKIKGFQAFVERNGMVEVLDVGREESSAEAINDEGTIVGFRYNQLPVPVYGGGPRYRADAFLWKNGKTYSLDQITGLTIDQESRLRMNQRGQILVHAKRQAYLLSPIVK